MDGDGVKTVGKQLQQSRAASGGGGHVWKHDTFSRQVKPEGAEETSHVSVHYLVDLWLFNTGSVSSVFSSSFITFH